MDHIKDDFLDVRKFTAKQVGSVLESLKKVNEILGDSSGVLQFPGAPAYNQKQLKKLVARKKKEEEKSR